MNILSVSELNDQIKSLLESHFLEVAVEGEVSRHTYHSSGHLYFSLKDEKSVIKCVMFRSALSRVRFRLEDGQQLLVIGKIGVYKPRGEYQLYATSLEPAGIGSLQLAFEQLKEELAKKGYFDKKRSLPPFISSMAIVTSATGAALQDMLRIINRRWPLVKVYVVDTLVQGKEAAQSIADSLRFADSLGVDAIVVGRGGGSMEDLWCFNEEVVADAIFEAKTPIVSAVGHEIDYVISDFVADLRAPTPSAAIEMIFPDRDEVLQSLDELMDRFTHRMEAILYQKSEKLRYLQKSLVQLSPLQKLTHLEQKIQSLKSAFESHLKLIFQTKAQELPRVALSYEHTLKERLQAKESALQLLKNRFEMALKSKELPKGLAQVVKENRALNLEDLQEDDIFELQRLDIKVKAKVLSKEKKRLR